MKRPFFKLFICSIFFVLSSLLSHINADERIKMTYENGVYTMPCEVNGLRMKFIFDTGASKVSISSTEALFMLKNGYLDYDDFIGTSKTRIANGDIIDNYKVVLKTLKIGNTTLENVEAIVSKSLDAPLLLGQSVLRRLGEWSFNSDYLVIKNENQNDYEEDEDSIDPETLNKIKELANQGDAQAQCALGECYYYGDGVYLNYDKAVNWFTKSAKQGYATAQFYLGLCYNNGEGVKKEHTQAVYWYRKAAEQGDADAQFNLGGCFYFGEGEKKDYTQAAYWFRKAAEQGHAEAQNNLGVCYNIGDGVNQDYTQAVYWYRKAAEQGHAKAQFNLGHCYENGEGVTKDKRKAVSWYRKAAAQGDEKANAALKKLGY